MNFIRLSSPTCHRTAYLFSKVKDYYQVLDISPKADTPSIKKAY